MRPLRRMLVPLCASVSPRFRSNTVSTARMDQALAPAALHETPSGPLARLAALPAGARFKLGAGLALLLATIVAIGLWSSQGD